MGARGKIFISYRRDDAPGDARGICDRLAGKFGKANVFMDVDNLLAGQRFDRELEKALSQCDVLIAVIGPRWMKLLSGHTRTGDRDYVHDEIAAALKRDITVIPTLVGRKGHMPSLPNENNLPEDIRALVLHHKQDIAHESFGRDADELVEAVKFVRRGGREPRSWRTIAISGVIALVLATGLVGYWLTMTPPHIPQPAAIVTAHPNSDAVRAVADEAARNKAAEEEATKKAAQAKRQVEVDAAKKVEEDAKQQAEADAGKKKAEEEAQRQAETDAVKKKAEEAARRKAAEEEARRKADEDAKRQAEADAAKKAKESLARTKAADEATRKAAEEAERQAEADAARKKVEEDLARKKAADEDANAKAAELARRRTEAYTAAARAADEAAKKKAEEESARKKAEEEARLAAIVTDCDRLAASPFDTTRPVGLAGVDFAKVDVAASTAACDDATGRYPEVARFIYQAGRVADVRKDYMRAAELYLAAISKGSIIALAALGAMYDNGRGIRPDPIKARRWYEQSAALDNAFAMYSLGLLYEKGRGVPLDYAAARMWYEKAATLGNTLAMNNLGHLYRDGLGVHRNYVEARNWYQKAADAGNEEAKGKLKNLK